MQGQNHTFYHSPVQSLVSVVPVNALVLLYIAFLFFRDDDKDKQ